MTEVANGEMFFFFTQLCLSGRSKLRDGEFPDVRAPNGARTCRRDARCGARSCVSRSRRASRFESAGYAGRCGQSGDGHVAIARGVVRYAVRAG
jgi:hypothetical protein